jgi:hypothetical protein
MMNIRTLVGLYPKARPKLTATQIMSLHLLLHQPKSSNDVSKDKVFGSYVSILPSDFDAHPLTWLLRPRDPLTEREDLEIGHDLLEHVPKGVLGSLEQMAARFRSDWERVARYLVSFGHFDLQRITLQPTLMSTSETTRHYWRPQRRRDASFNRWSR